MWHLREWRYRKVQRLGKHSRAGKNFLIQLVVYFREGEDNYEEVYLNRTCKSDFSDIRFVDERGRLLLYKRTGYSEGDRATFSIRILTDLSKTESLLYIYWGNPNALYEGKEIEFDFYQKFTSEEEIRKNWNIFKTKDAYWYIQDNRLYLVPQSGNIWFVSKRVFDTVGFWLEYNEPANPLYALLLTENGYFSSKGYVQGGYGGYVYYYRFGKKWYRVERLFLMLGEKMIQIDERQMPSPAPFPPVSVSIFWQDNYKQVDGFINETHKPFGYDINTKKYRLAFGLTAGMSSVSINKCGAQRYLKYSDYMNLFIPPYWRPFELRDNYYVKRTILTVEEDRTKKLKQSSLATNFVLVDVSSENILRASGDLLSLNEILYKTRIK